MKQVSKEEIEIQLKNEENTKNLHITPILMERWGIDRPENVITEYKITDGRVSINGEKVKRTPCQRADYVLFSDENIPLAVVEAKGFDHDAVEGYQQVIAYAAKLGVPFAYTTNGKEVIEEDLINGTNRTITMKDFPTPQELWQRYTEKVNVNEQGVDLMSYSDYIDPLKPSKRPRYYQRIAINKCLEAISQDRKRMLLVMATGTGKTYTAFQIVWKLYKTKRFKKILYLVDRNALATQTMNKDFKPFVDMGVMTQIVNTKLKKQTAYEVYIALYQQLINKENDYYKTFPAAFFDLIIVDECHRGSADQTGNWHAMLDYFGLATQIGLTATPKETEDVSNIGYFCKENNDKPIYTYSLKQGIDDGFLAPYRVIAVELNIDERGYIPEQGKLDIEGKPVENRTYTQKDFDRTIVVQERRETVAQRITDYMKDNNCRYAKTIVFCERTDHAAEMVRLLKNLNKDLVAENEKYVMRITGDDDDGKKELENFTDPNTKYPVIAVTSKLMSTGIDTETCELIVLDRTIGSPTEFKQTIGRGTRIKKEFKIDKETKTKLHFTILDFRKNYVQFRDPNFDGDPVAVMSVGDSGEFPKGARQKNEEGSDDDTDAGNKKAKRKLVEVNGVTVTIEGEEVSFSDEDGNLVKENLESCVKNNILAQYPTFEEFYSAWLKEGNKNSFANKLLLDPVFIAKARKRAEYSLDKYDIICRYAYNGQAKSKEERLNQVLQSNLFTSLPDEKRKFIELVLKEYLKSDFQKLKEPSNVFALPGIKEAGYMPIVVIKELFGSKQKYTDCINQFENKLYE